MYHDSIPLESEEMEDMESDTEATTEEFGVGTGSNPSGVFNSCCRHPILDLLQLQ